MTLVKEIIENLFEGTSNNSIEWKTSNSYLNSDTQKYFEFFSVDGKTRFLVQICMDDSFLLKPGMVNLHMYNNELINGYKFLPAYSFNEIEKLAQIVYNKYVAPNIPQKSDNHVYESILSNIFSKQHKRDQRIESIICDEDTSDIEKRKL